MVRTALWLLCTLVAVPAPARAARPRFVDSEAATEVLRLNRQAMDFYSELDFDHARAALAEALAVGAAGGLMDHESMVRTHGNLALLYAVGLRDDERAIKHFRRALEMRATFRPGREYVTPDVDRLFARARMDLAQAASPGPARDKAIGPRRAQAGGALRCPSGGEVQAGEDVTLRCVAAGGPLPADVTLFLKRPGHEDFDAVPMERARAPSGPVAWVARIAASELGGHWLPFYFEAHDARGAVVAVNGSMENPNIITVHAAARGATSTAPAVRALDDENPLASRVSARAEEEPPPGKLWLALGAGSGAGYAGGNGVEAYGKHVRQFNPGFALAGLFHLLPELGYFVKPTLAVSLQGRHQFIARDSAVTASGAHAVLARLHSFRGSDAARFYGVVMAGGGEGFRLQVQAVTSDGSVVHDTVRGGPLLAGAGAGFAWRFNRAWSWTIETSALAGFPSFSAVVDLDTGVRANF